MVAPGSVPLKTMPDDPDPSPTIPPDQGPFRGPFGDVEILTDAARPVRIVPRQGLSNPAARNAMFIPFPSPLLPKEGERKIPVRSTIRRPEPDPRPSGTGARESSWNR
jgi:hypothetical protein